MLRFGIEFNETVAMLILFAPNMQSKYSILSKDRGY